jgi:uncharacterized protein (DUF4415 family)
MNEKNTGKTVKFKLDPKNPPQLSAATKKRLTQMQDQDIDFSDIPPSPIGVTWSQPGALIANENKQQVTLRLDADVINFFKCTGKRYQSRINAALREYMNLHRRSI